MTSPHSLIQPPEEKYGRIDGPVVMIGLGSIGRGLLPLLERHFDFDRSRFTVIDPDDSFRTFAEERGGRFLQERLVRENVADVLRPLLSGGGGQGFVINVAVDVSSIDVSRFAAEMNALYIDTTNEPWFGFFFDKNLDHGARSVYALREMMLAERLRRQGQSPTGPTAVMSCGANPGMVSWLVKEALLRLSADLGLDIPAPQTREDWARLMQQTGVKGLHIAERDMQRAARPKKMGVFVNTWSVEGLIAEGLQAAELGWGTHEKWLPSTARLHDSGCRAAIYLLEAGGQTRVRSWCPTPGPQFGFVVPHHEVISIADYFTLGDPAAPDFRPTVNYAYRPSNHALLSLEELFGRGKIQKEHQVLDEGEIADGSDELGVLLYGHAKNALWYGSQLSIEQTRLLAPHQNATGLQVTSAVIAGMVWALENPDRGIVEAEEMDYRRCLDIQKSYLGQVSGYYTDWTPLKGRPGPFPEDLDMDDPWQFKNILLRRPG